jgi:mono/diheme cytochrome c family protein
MKHAPAPFPSLLLLVLLGPFRPDAPAEAQDLKVARKLYRATCEECHGPDGHGDGEKARSLGFRARDFSHGSFKCRCTPSGALPTDEDLLRTVENGLPGTPMLGHADDLTADERRTVIAYVKSLVPRFAAETAPACIAIPEPPPPAPAAVEEGRAVYRLLGCAKCHGATGEADGPSAASLVDDWGDRIRVHNFVKSGKFKCGGEPRDLYRTLHTGMNGSPMPSFTAAFAFAREDTGGLAALEAQLGGAAAEEVRAYLARQPDRGAVAAMTDAERRALVDRRTWALVEYLRSLLAR